MGLSQDQQQKKKMHIDGTNSGSRRQAGNMEGWEEEWPIFTASALNMWLEMEKAECEAEEEWVGGETNTGSMREFQSVAGG